MNYKTQGIVIRRSNLGEADRILTIFTERFGKVKAIAKGVRKIKSKMAGSLEPFMLVDFELYQGKTFYTVTSASILDAFVDLHQVTDKISKAFYLGELVDKFLSEDQRNQPVFSDFIKALQSVENQSDEVFIRIFEFKLIENTGFSPEINFCLHCKQKLTPGRNYWDSIEGGVICSNCQAKFKHGVAVSDNLIKLFRLIHEAKDIFGLKIKDELKKEADRILSLFIESILEREIKSKKYL